MQKNTREYDSWEALFPSERRGSNFPEGVPNSLGNFTRGCHIHWGPKFPVTPGPGVWWEKGNGTVVFRDGHKNLCFREQGPSL